MAEKVFTTVEAAEHLRLKVTTIRKYVKSGKIRGVKIGNDWRILDSDLQEYLDGLKAARNSKKSSDDPPVLIV